ncbi:hypothetical protein D3C87_684100 [compost metagenome]
MPLYYDILFLMAIFSQLIVGSLAMTKRIGISFGWLTLSNFVFTCFVTFGLLQIVAPKVEEPKCGMSQIVILFLGIGTMGIQIFIMILQLLWIYAMRIEIEK